MVRCRNSISRIPEFSFARHSWRRMTGSSILWAVMILPFSYSHPAVADVSCRVAEHEIALGAGDCTYTLGDDGRIQPLGIYVNIAGFDAAGKGIWIVPKKLRESKVRTDTDKVKTVPDDVGSVERSVEGAVVR